MLLILFFSIKAMFTQTPVLLDGKEDRVYLQADSVMLSFETFPMFGNKPKEKTVVKLLYDEKNLYVLFKCYTEDGPTILLGGNEDQVTLYLDPFYSRTTAYYFSVSVSGEKYDGILFDDGRRKDPSWEGIWYAKTWAGKDIWVAEIKIPFKSIRYKKNIKKWGIQFERYVAKHRRGMVWKGYKQEEGMLVSGFGDLFEIKPRVKGYAFELYPVGVLRQNLYENEEEFVKRGGVDFSWGVTPSLMFQATFYPDFAEIEADPYRVNLSKYETYYPEKRPFFVEGADIFKPASMGQGMGFYSPFELLYTRRIGKKLPDGREVPIITGTKITQKEKTYDLGVLGVFTDSLEDIKKALWTAGRCKRRMFENSEIGFLGILKYENNSSFIGVDIDGAFRWKGGSQLLFQFVQTKDTVWGKGINIGGVLSKEKWIVICFGRYTDERFNFNKTGYMTFDPKERKITIGAGPRLYFKTGFLNLLTAGVAGGAETDVHRVEYSLGTSEWITFVFRDGSGLSFNHNIGGSGGEIVGNDTLFYTYTHTNLNYWSSRGRMHYGFWTGYKYTYNYAKAWLGKQLMGNFWFYWNPLPRIGVNINGTVVLEYDPSGRIYQKTFSIEPRFSSTLSPDVYFNLYFQPVYFSIPSEGIGLDIFHLLTGGLFAWEIKPKSWFYIAFTSIREKREEKLTETERVIALKIKWVFNF